MHSSEPSLAVPSSSLIPLNGSVSQEPAPSKINPYNSKCKSYITESLVKTCNQPSILNTTVAKIFQMN